MKILLINPDKKGEIRIPQGLLYLGSAIKSAGYTVSIHDEVIEESLENSLKKIISYNADVIGLSVYSVPWQLRRAEYISRVLKSESRSSTIIWGGWHPTLHPQSCILTEGVDIVVRGPAEKTICQILDKLKQNKSLELVQGLTLLKDNQIKDTGPECIEPQYLFPSLDFSLIDLDVYLDNNTHKKRILQYTTTRGCYAMCRFCIMASVFKGKMVRKPRVQIVEELKCIFNKYKIDSISISDDNAFHNEKEAIELCDVIEEATNGGVPWRAITRINTVANLSTETYQKLVSSGCNGLGAGIESSSDRVLKLMGKAINVSLIEKALKCLMDNGLKNNNFNFLFNFDGETKKEAVQTLQFIRKIRLNFPQSDIYLNVFFPGGSYGDLKLLGCTSSTYTPLSELFEKYYNNYIRSYSVNGININILRYYFNASKQKEEGDSKSGVLKRIVKKLIHVRIKYNIFWFPFEYYLSVWRIRKNRY